MSFPSTAELVHQLSENSFQTSLCNSFCLLVFTRRGGGHEKEVNVYKLRDEAEASTLSNGFFLHLSTFYCLEQGTQVLFTSVLSSYVLSIWVLHNLNQIRDYGGRGGILPFLCAARARAMSPRPIVTLTRPDANFDL